TGARDVRVHLRPAEFLVGGDLSSRRLEQRWSGKKRLGATTHHDDDVGEPGHVRPAGGARTVHDTDHRQTRSGETREVVKTFAAVNEVFDAVLEQVGAGRFDEVHERQPVLERDVLDALEFFEAKRLQRARVDAGIVGEHQAARTRYVTDHRDRTTTWRGGLGVARSSVV